MTDSLETKLALAQEFEEEYLGLYDLSLIKKLRDEKAREVFFSKLPVPFSFEPSYIIDGEEYSILDASLVQNDSLDEISEASSIIHNQKMKIGKSARHLLYRTYLTNITVCTLLDKEDNKISFDGIKLRKYEEIPAIIHSIKVNLLLPDNAPYWVKVLALTHDTPEDSYRHEALRKILKRKKLSSLESLLLEQVYSFNKKELTMEEYDLFFERTMDEFIDIIKPSKRYMPRIREGLALLTRKAYESYEEYMIRITSTEDNNLAYWLMIIKMNDRTDNSHFTAPLNQITFEKNGTKILKDGLKNIYVLDASKKVYMRLKKDNSFSDTDMPGSLSKAEFEKRMYSLAGLTNRNMDSYMLKIKELYGKESLELDYKGKHMTKTLEQWMDILEKEMYKDYKKTRFRNYDTKKGDPKKIFEFRGSMALMDDFIEKREKIFDDLSDMSQVLMLYKYAGIAKTLSCQYLSCTPFEKGRLILEGGNTYGMYDVSLEDYTLRKFMAIRK